MGARKTSAAKMMIGGNAWFQDLTDFVAGFNVNGAVNIQRLTVLESEGVESLALSVQHSINIPTMFYGAATGVLNAHQADEIKFVVAFDENAGDELCYFGQCGYSGLPVQGPTDNVISHTLDIIQTEKWAYSTKLTAVVPFTLDDTTISVDFGAPLETDEQMMLVVTDFNDAAAVTLTIAQALTVQIVNDEGIWWIDRSGITAQVASPTISIAATLGTGDFVTGYLFVGKYFEVSD